MNRTVYVNGEYVAEQEASISIFDRGFLFADAVYEVTAVLEGKLVDNAGHLARLERSCSELGVKMPVTGAQLTEIQRSLIKKNNLTEGGVYLQLTRGNEGDRDFSYSDDIEPTLVMFTQQRALIESKPAKEGIKILSMDDMRWRRRDIKTTSLLPACLAKHIAHQAGCDDVWLIENGYITEGGSSNAYIVTQDDKIVTRPLSKDILHGITRASLLKLAEDCQLEVEERPFTIAEAYQAKEAFVSSATTFIWPVTSIDGHTIGTGKPGAIAAKLRDIYIRTALELAE